MSVPNDFSPTALYPQEVLVMALKAFLTLYFSSAFSFLHLQEMTWTKIAEKHISASWQTAEEISHKQLHTEWRRGGFAKRRWRELGSTNFEWQIQMQQELRPVWVIFMLGDQPCTTSVFAPSRRWQFWKDQQYICYEERWKDQKNQTFCDLYW